MNQKKNLYRKTNILNRFIAVKYTNIPKQTEDSFIIRPLNDGLGFILKLENFSKIGASEKDIEYILNKVQKINNVISKEYCKFKRNEIPIHFSNRFNDGFILFSFTFCFCLLFAVEILLESKQEDFLCFILLGFFMILLVVYFYLFSAFCIKIKKKKIFSDILPEHVEPVLSIMKIYLKAKNFNLEYDEKYFWIKISKSV